MSVATATRGADTAATVRNRARGRGEGEVPGATTGPWSHGCPAEDTREA